MGIYGAFMVIYVYYGGSHGKSGPCGFRIEGAPSEERLFGTSIPGSGSDYRIIKVAVILAFNRTTICEC